MLDHVVTDDDVAYRIGLERRVSDVALDDVDLLGDGREIVTQDPIDRVTEFQSDHASSTSLAHPERLGTTAGTAIHNDLLAEDAEISKSVLHEVIKPVDLEVDEVEEVPFVSERPNDA